MQNKKIILITGGSEGLGREIAKKLSADNQIIILATDSNKLEASAKEIDCDILVCDVTKYDQIESVVKIVLEKYGRIDVLINNAGLWIEGKLEDNNPDQIHKVIEVNTLGPIWFSHAVIPQMKKQKSGIIINVISQAGIASAPERSVYYASKWAITGFTKSLYLELETHGIRVMGIYPAMLNTKLFEKAGNVKDLSDALDPAEVAKTIEFALSLNPDTHLLDFGIKHLGTKRG